MFRQLSTLDDLDHAIAASHAEPIVLFKHSSTCGTSAMAREEMAELVADTQSTTPVYLLHIQSARAVSNAVAERFHLRHESPQVLIISRGDVIWHRSHFHVTATAVQSALSAARATVDVAAPGPTTRSV
jgi:bacillithiol system protein YtxJ